MTDFQAILRELVHIEGSQPVLARQLGISTRTLTHLLSGTRSPSVKMLRSIGRAYPGLRKDLTLIIWPQDEEVTP